MIPNHDDAVNAALLAIAKAFQAGKPGQEEWPAESVEDRARYILQELAHQGTRDAKPREDQTAMLAERCDAVALPVGVVVRLLMDTVELPPTLKKLEDAEREADRFVGLVAAAISAFNDPRIKGQANQMKAGMRALGLTRRRPDDKARFLADYEKRVRGFYDPVGGNHVPPVDKPTALRQTAERFGKTKGAMCKALSREITRMREADKHIPPLLPRDT